jgi:hypothetical protein
MRSAAISIINSLTRLLRRPDSSGLLATTEEGLVPASLLPRYIRYIDKRKPAVIINPSYFGKFFDLPIDKIDIIVLKLIEACKKVLLLFVLN